MIVTCPSCAARYKLDDGKVTGRGAKIKCPSCRFVFIVYPQSSAAEEEQVAQELTAPAAAVAASAVAPAVAEAAGGASAVVSRPGAARPAPPPPTAPRRSADTLDFRKVGIASWKVRVKFGLVYDFSDIRTLRKYIQDGKVTSDDVISHDGQRWVIIGDIPDLDGYFVKIYDEAEESQKVAAKEKPSGFEDDESPTMIVGMGTLASDLAADALRQATAPSNPATPSPPTPSGDAQFVDPFAALKSKQRDRIQKRRAATTAPVVEGGSAGNKRLPLIGAAVVALIAAGWWYSQREVGPVKAPEQPVQGAGGADARTPTQPAADGSAAADVRALVDNSLSASPRTDIAAEDEEQPVLVPVGPGAQPVRSTGPGKAPVVESGAPLSSGITTSATTAEDHLAACRDSAQRRDWKVAKIGCRAAVDAGVGGAEIVAWYGIALYETGDANSAAQKLGQAAKAGTSVREVKKYLGHIARDNGDTAGAIGHYQQYVNGNPPDKAAIEEEIRKLTGS